MDTYERQRAKHRELRTAHKKGRKQKRENIEKVLQQNKERENDTCTNLIGHATS